MADFYTKLSLEDLCAPVHPRSAEHMLSKSDIQTLFLQQGDSSFAELAKFV